VLVTATNCPRGDRSNQWRARQRSVRPGLWSTTRAVWPRGRSRRAAAITTSCQGSSPPCATLTPAARGASPTRRWRRHPDPGARRLLPRGRRLRAARAGHYAVGTRSCRRRRAEAAVRARSRPSGQEPSRSGLARVADQPRRHGKSRRPVMPRFAAVPGRIASRAGPGRLAYCVRRRAERDQDVYFPSLSSGHRLQAC